MSKSVSLRDVARSCGVSATTVSCVVRRVNCVKESTRLKVEAAIRELGYQVDPALRALAAYRSGKQNAKTYRATVAFLDSEPSEYARVIYEACRLAAGQLGYELSYFEFPATREKQAAFGQKLWARGIRGVLLGPARQAFDLGGFQFERFAMVGIGAFQHHPPIDVVCADYFQGLSVAAQHCWEMGFRCIGLCLPEMLEARTGHRWQGAYRAFCLHHHQPPLEWLFPTRRNPAASELLNWIRTHRIDALLTLGSLAAAVQDRVFLLSLNDWNIRPGTACIRTPPEQLAQQSMQLLDMHLIQQNYGATEWPRQVLIKPVFSPG